MSSVRAFGAADADRVDPDAAVGRRLRGLRAGPGSVVFSPSDSSTMVAAANVPGGTGVGSGVGAGDAPAGAE